MGEPYYDHKGITIWHGDCREILPTLEAGSVDEIFTDPPYGHNNNNGDLISRWEAALGKGDYEPDRDNRPIANDGKEANELVRWFFAESARLLKPGCCCSGGGGGPDPQFARWGLTCLVECELQQLGSCNHENSIRNRHPAIPSARPPEP